MGLLLLVFAVDLLLVIAASIVGFVALTGGIVFTIGHTPISITRTGNPITFGAVLACLRYLYLATLPWFGFSRSAPIHLDVAAANLLDRLTATGDVERRPTRVVLVFVLVTSTILRLVNAWSHPGFTTGDDVEIHEMTLGRLLGESWSVWSLRSPLYPMSFVYPFQAAASFLAGDDMQWLVFAGRLPVVGFATITVWLVYRITLRLTNSHGTAVIAAAFLAASRLHVWFGSSELPRPVASAFLLAAFWNLIAGNGPARALVAGVLIGIGGALRFGELVFFLPALLHLAVERRWREAIVTVVVGTFTAGLCLGVADWFYWGRPFFSLINVVDYTLVQGASSRGFQAVWYYIVDANDWTNFVFLALGLVAIRKADRRVALWTWVPVVMLSILPHKEARYLIPVLPFLCIGAAIVLTHSPASAAPRHKTLLVFAVLVAVLFEFSNWRFRRSDEGVRLAQRINALRPSGVAMQQLWPFGGRLYLRDVDGPLVEIRGPVDLSELQQHDVEILVLRRRLVDIKLREALLSRGYFMSEALSTAQYATFARRP